MQHRDLLRQVGSLTGKWLLPNLAIRNEYHTVFQGFESYDMLEVLQVLEIQIYCLFSRNKNLKKNKAEPFLTLP
jgi:hypothetical protein